MKRLEISFIISFFICLALNAQTDKNSMAYSTIKEATTEVICTSLTEYTDIKKRVVQINDEKGKDAIQFIGSCNKFRELKKFSGSIIDQQGNVIKKIKKSDLIRTEYSNEMASDDYYYYFNYVPPTYPITIVYEWEMKIEDGFINFPTFVPQEGYNQAVEKSLYKLTTPKDIAPIIHLSNIPQNAVTKTENADFNIIEIALQNLSPIEPEPYAPSIKERIPHALIVPASFCYDGYNGEQTSWNKVGEWQYNLMEGLDELPAPLLEEVHKITSDCESTIDKVRAIYDYLARTTRYVSIQLGIGGLKPFSAEKVYQTGFGDCKALSNYARSMLAAINIPSYYTVISTEDRKFITDFSSVSQGNHVILQVPLPTDTLWLECTNPKLPFGYVHQSIAGHDAMVVKPTGGELHTLPNYPDSLNAQNINALITINQDGNNTIKVKMSSHAFQYEDKSGIEKLPSNKKKDVLLSNLSIGKAEVSEIVFHEDKSPIPHSSFEYLINVSRYGKKTGKRLFIPTNVFHKQFAIPNNKSNRTQPIQINYGYMDTDSITIKIPKGYEIEYIPQSTSINNNFGKLISTYTISNNEIHIVNSLLIKSGVYGKELFSQFIDFRKEIKKQYDAEIVLKQIAEQIE